MTPEERADLDLELEIIELQTNHPELTNQDVDQILAVYLVHLEDGGPLECECGDAITLTCFYEPWKKLRIKFLEDNK